jgi:hypothetical protein
MKTRSKNFWLTLVLLVLGQSALLVTGCDTSSSSIYDNAYGNNSGGYYGGTGYYDPWYGGGYYGHGYGYGGGVVVVAPPVNRPINPRPVPLPAHR